MGQRRAGAGREAGLDRTELLDARDARDRLLHGLELMAELLDRAAEHVGVLEEEEHRPEGDRSAEPEVTAHREREGVPERDGDQRARPDDRATDDRLPSSPEPGAMLKDQAVHHVALGPA